MLAACSSKEVKQEEKLPPLASEDVIKRGKYLTTIGACNDCHSPKIMTEHGPVIDTTRLLSGHPENEAIPPINGNQGWVLFSPGITAFSGPWGISYAANLTPDDTGIGNWSFKQFETAIRKGKYKGLEAGRPLMPPMPWEMYRNFTDEDLQAVYAYLKSLKPVNNSVPAYTPPQQAMHVSQQR